MICQSVGAQPSHPAGIFYQRSCLTLEIVEGSAARTKGFLPKPLRITKDTAMDCGRHWTVGLGGPAPADLEILRARNSVSDTRIYKYGFEYLRNVAGIRCHVNRFRRWRSQKMVDYVMLDFRITHLIDLHLGKFKSGLAIK